MEPQIGLIKTGIEGFVFQDEYNPRKGRIAAGQKHPEPQPCLYQHLPQRVYDVYNQVHARDRMIIYSHEVKRELAKMEFEGFALMDDNYQGRKWRLGARERREEIMNIQNHDRVFQRIAAMDENYGRNWRVAAHQQKREDITNQNHQAKAEQLADILFQRPAPMDENHHGRKWRVAAPQRQLPKQQAYNYYQSEQPEQQPYIYEEVKKPAPGTEEVMVMDAYEAARLYGGVLIIDYAR